MSATKHPKTQPGTGQPEITIGVGEVAKRTGISIRQVRFRIATGELRSIKVGSRRLVRIRDLEAFLDARDATPRTEVLS